MRHTGKPRKVKQAKSSQAPPPGRRQMLHAAYLAKWRQVDWTKQNIEIATETGLTPERIRQIRRMLRVRPSPRHGRQHSTRAGLQWARENFARLQGLTYEEVQKEFGRSINRSGLLYRYLKEHKAMRDSRVKHPWARMNFALPSQDLGRIWRLPFNMAASYRYRKGIAGPRWSYKGGPEPLQERRHRRAYLGAVHAEERKAQEFFARNRLNPKSAVGSRRSH